MRKKEITDTSANNELELVKNDNVDEVFELLETELYRYYTNIEPNMKFTSEA